jgi:hypothetical protein
MPYLHQTYLYQKDERALPGDLRSRKSKFMFPPPVKSSAYRYSPHFIFSLSSTCRFKGAMNKELERI